MTTAIRGRYASKKPCVYGLELHLLDTDRAKPV